MSQLSTTQNFLSVPQSFRTNNNYQRQRSSPMPGRYADHTTEDPTRPAVSRQSSSPGPRSSDFTDGLLAKLPKPWQTAPQIVPFNAKRSSSKIPEAMELHLAGGQLNRFACTGPQVDGEWTADALIAGIVSEKKFLHQRFYRYVIKSSHLLTPEGGQPCLIESAVEGRFIGIWKKTVNNSLVTDVAIREDDILEAAQRKTKLVWVMKQVPFDGDIFWTFSPYGQTDVFLCLATTSNSTTRLTVALDDGKIGKHFKFY